MALRWLYVLAADHREAESGEGGEDAGRDDTGKILALHKGILERGVASAT